MVSLTCAEGDGSHVAPVLCEGHFGVIKLQVVQYDPTVCQPYGQYILWRTLKVTVFTDINKDKISSTDDVNFFTSSIL